MHRHRPAVANMDDVAPAAIVAGIGAAAPSGLPLARRRRDDAAEAGSTSTPFSRLCTFFPRRSACEIRAALTAADGDVGAAAAGLAAASQSVRPRRPRPKLSVVGRRLVTKRLRAQVVPAIRGRFFAGMEMRDHESERFWLRGVEVLGVEMGGGEGGVVCGAVAGGWRVHVGGGVLDLDVGEWGMKKGGWMGWEDGGRARVTAAGVVAKVMLQPVAVGSSVGLKVISVEVEVEGMFRLRCLGSAADWAYNAMAVLLKPLVLVYVKAAMCDVIQEVVEEQLGGWLCWDDDVDGREERKAEETERLEKEIRNAERSARKARADAEFMSPVTSDEAPGSPPPQCPPMPEGERGRPKRPADFDDDEIRPVDESDYAAAAMGRAM